jgi:rubrerythrin
MNRVELDAIIAYAVEKEQEAVDFYSGLAGRVDNQAVARELRRIADMEKGHRDRLQKLDLESFALGKPVKAANLRIADYLVRQEPRDDMSWQDVIAIAMQREQASLQLYTDLSVLAIDGTLKKVFALLASEETAHKSYFEKLWDEKVLIEN